MSKPVDASSKSEIQYGAIIKSLVTTTALLALSVIAVQAIERYGKKTFTSFEKQGAGLLALPIYLFASTYIFPWHKPLSTITLEGLTEQKQPDYEWIQDQINQCRETELILGIKNGDNWFSLKIDLSTEERKDEALQHCQQKISSFPPSLPLTTKTPSPSAKPSQSLQRVNLQDLPQQTKRFYEITKSHIPTHNQLYMMLLVKINDQGEDQLVDIDLSTEEKKQAALVYCQKQIDSFASPAPVQSPADRGGEQSELSLLQQVNRPNLDGIAIESDINNITNNPPIRMSNKDDDDEIEERVSGEDSTVSASSIVTAQDLTRKDSGQLPPLQIDNDDEIEERVLDGVSHPYRAVYNPEVHGVNGSLMREKYFDALLQEIKRGVQEQRIDVEQSLANCREIEGKKQRSTSSNGNSYLITMLEALQPDPKRTAEVRYGALVQAHRNLLHLKDNSMICMAFVRARMTPKMQAFQESYVGEFLGKHGKTLTLENFSEEFKERNEAVKKAPQGMKMAQTGTLSRQFFGAVNLENYYDVNPPNHLEMITLKKGEETRTIDYIRGPTPHLVRAFIEPTFEAYLTILDEEKKGFLYSAHQRLKDQKSGLAYLGQFEIEDHRSQELIKLEEKHPNFLLIFQSVENQLFKEDTISISDLKEMIKKSFTSPEGRNQNRLPRCLQQNKDYEERMDALLNLVEGFFFKDVKGNLSPTDRQSFVLYFYALQRLDLMTGDYLDGKPVAAMTTPCKDFYDRGLGQALMTRIINLVLIYGKEGIPSQKLEEIANAGQFPPLLGKGLPAIEHRFGPACEALKRLSTTDGVDSLQTFDFHGWKINGTTVHRQEGQSAIPFQDPAV